MSWVILTIAICLAMSIGLLRVRRRLSPVVGQPFERPIAAFIISTLAMGFLGLAIFLILAMLGFIRLIA